MKNPVAGDLLFVRNMIRYYLQLSLTQVQW